MPVQLVFVLANPKQSLLTSMENCSTFMNDYFQTSWNLFSNFWSENLYLCGVDIIYTCVFLICSIFLAAMPPSSPFWIRITKARWFIPAPFVELSFLLPVFRRKEWCNGLISTSVHPWRQCCPDKTLTSVQRRAVPRGKICSTDR